MPASPQTLTEADTQTLIRATLRPTGAHVRHLTANRNALLLLLMLDAGLRIGEACKIMRLQLHTPAGPCPELRLLDWQTKTRTPRTIPLTTRITQIAGTLFQTHWPHDESLAATYALNLIHCRHSLPVRTAQDIVRRCSIAALGREIRPHWLRHTFATRIMRHNDIRIVQELLGHASIRSTQIYTHPSADDLSRAIRTIDPVST